MLPQPQGSFRLFRVAGIDVYLHWSWLIVAFIEMRRMDHYTMPFWNVIEYVTLFGIVLLHEFGHALACRSVGGVAQQIVLWPLGGVAYVNPPPRPGAVLWSIAAGPLVNLVLVPLTFLFYFLCRPGQGEDLVDLTRFAQAIMIINLGLLIFNMLPIYPLDGGQILQALLWFVLGRARSLMITSVMGLLAGIAVIALALQYQKLWLGIVAAFVVLRAWNGFQQARALAQLMKMARHEGLACPACGAAPLKGEFWPCSYCRRPFDVFATGGRCQECGSPLEQPFCFDCQTRHPLATWYPAVKPVETVE